MSETIRSVPAKKQQKEEEGRIAQRRVDELTRIRPLWEELLKIRSELPNLEKQHEIAAATLSDASNDEMSLQVEQAEISSRLQKAEQLVPVANQIVQLSGAVRELKRDIAFATSTTGRIGRSLGQVNEEIQAVKSKR